jgi:DNA-binding transcriptional MocR family regulator
MRARVNKADPATVTGSVCSIFSYNSWIQRRNVHYEDVAMVTRYEQVAIEFSTLISRGVFRPGDRIPSVRKACVQYHVNAGTILQAYGQLEACGLINARPRSGYYVRAREAWAPEPVISSPRPGSTRVDVANLVFDVLASIKDRTIVPLGSAFPSPELFPLEKLNKIAAATARRLPTWSSIDDLTPGNDELRRLIGLRYLESGFAVSADNIVITSGAMEAINLCLQAVTRAGDIIAIESPTFYSTLMAIERMGLKAVEIATHPREGIDLSSLRAALNRYDIKACIFNPTFQNPLGSCMPDHSKRELVGLLARYGVPLVEDDVYAELYFGDSRPRPAKAFDHEGLVLHCGSFAKCLAPGYRVGWAAPGRFKDAVERLKFMTTLTTASLPKATIAEYLKHGGFDRHLRGLRHNLSVQLQQMRQALASHFPAGCRITRPEGGYMLWIELPQAVEALRLRQLALEKRISIAPGPIFSAHRGYSNFVRMNFGHPWSNLMEDAVKKLGALTAELARPAP